MDLTTQQLKKYAIAFKDVGAPANIGTASNRFFSVLAQLVSDALQAEYHERCNEKGVRQEPK